MNDAARMSDQEAGPVDRELQRSLLLAMRDCYPELLYELPATIDAAKPRVDTNLFYLEEHGLCDSGLSPNAAGYSVIRGPRITARGLDFLADDGGLTAILGVVTVRLHADTIRDLIAVKIEALPVPAAEKSALRKILAGLPADALRAATTDLVKSGLDHLPNVAHWLGALGG
jgi:hypothetical protein